MTCKKRKTKRDTLRYAICLRLVRNIADVSVANRWGVYEDSLGYKEAKRIFNEKYTLIKFEEFENEIVLSWYRKFLNTENKKRTMKEVLELDKSNEEMRNLFNKVNGDIRKRNKENALNGIDNKIKDNFNIINKSINNIDSFFYEEIIEKARDNNFNFKEIEEKDVNEMLGDINFIESSNTTTLDTDGFYESYLKYFNNKNSNLNKDKNSYNKETGDLVNASYYARLNTLPKELDKCNRKKTKKSIFDKIEDGNFKKMTLGEFIEQYSEIIEIYKFEIHKQKDLINRELGNVYFRCKNILIENRISNKIIHKVLIKSELINLDELAKFYYLEDRYNIIFFINLALELIEINSSYKTELIDKFSNLTILDLNIYRSKIFKNIAKDIVIEHERKENIAYNKVINEIKELIKLKELIVNDMMSINKIKYEYFDQEIKEYMFGVVEEILVQTIKVDIEEYLNNNVFSDKVFKYLKLLLHSNKKTLLERNKIINSIE